MGYILHRGDEKDPGADQFLNFDKWGCEIWQVQGAEPEAPYVLPVPPARTLECPTRDSTCEALCKRLTTSNELSQFYKASSERG